MPPKPIRSNNYALVCAHYKELLSEHYTWTFGGAEAKYAIHHALLGRYLQNTTGSALDLGCGSGFQTIPLLRMGFHVKAIDLSQHLLDELAAEAQRNGLESLETLQGDLLSFPLLTKEIVFNCIVCMGDTLTHLATIEEVDQLLAQTFQALTCGGLLILQYRDLTKPLIGTDRFIPVRSDERTVFTCFLEWEEAQDPQSDGSGCTIRVHDLVHVKKGIGAWELCKSWYRKLGLTGPFVVQRLEKIGFTMMDAVNESGMITLVCKKP